MIPSETSKQNRQLTLWSYALAGPLGIALPDNWQNVVLDNLTNWNIEGFLTTSFLFMNVHQVLITQSHLLQESTIECAQTESEKFFQELSDFAIAKPDLSAPELAAIGRGLLYSLYVTDAYANCAISRTL